MMILRFFYNCISFAVFVFVFLFPGITDHGWGEKDRQEKVKQKKKELENTEGLFNVVRNCTH